MTSLALANILYCSFLVSSKWVVIISWTPSCILLNIQIPMTAKELCTIVFYSSTIEFTAFFIKHFRWIWLSRSDISRKHQQISSSALNCVVSDTKKPISECLQTNYWWSTVVTQFKPVRAPQRSTLWVPVSHGDFASGTSDFYVDTGPPSFGVWIWHALDTDLTRP